MLPTPPDFPDIDAENFTITFGPCANLMIYTGPGARCRGLRVEGFNGLRVLGFRALGFKEERGGGVVRERVTPKRPGPTML